MAKLKAPLLSFGASGAIAKAIVYFPWKGLNVAREYVIPSNPQTKPQQDQRGYLRDAVTHYHEAFLEANPLDEEDIMAYALWGSTYPTPRTGFNQIVKNWIDQLKDSKFAVIFNGAVLTPAATLINLWCAQIHSDGVITDLDVYWGTSKTALINKQSISLADMEGGVDITDMPKSTKIFLQIRCTLPEEFLGARSGIYYAKTLAA